MRRETTFHRSARTTGRIQEIVRVMVKYGLSEWVRMLRLDKAVPGIRSLLVRRGPKPPKGASRWEIIRMAMEELGPTFIKLGQLLSNRTDVLPNELIRELSRLQDEVQPIPPKLITIALREELGRPANEVFRSFEETPTASASIAQVHRAELTTGEDVAVKIQRPGIETMIETDLDIVAYLARLAERYVPASRYRADGPRQGVPQAPPPRARLLPRAPEHGPLRVHVRETKRPEGARDLRETLYQPTAHHGVRRRNEGQLHTE